MRWKFLLGLISLVGAIAYGIAITGMYDSGLFEVPQFKAAFIGFVAVNLPAAADLVTDFADLLESADVPEAYVEDVATHVPALRQVAASRAGSATAWMQLAKHLTGVEVVLLSAIRGAIGFSTARRFHHDRILRQAQYACAHGVSGVPGAVAALVWRPPAALASATSWTAGMPTLSSAETLAVWPSLRRGC